MIASRDYTANPHSYTVVDVRSTEEHLASHLPESLHIPLAELDGRWTEVPPHQTIAVVCGKGGGRSIEGAQILASHGVTCRLSRWRYLREPMKQLFIIACTALTSALFAQEIHIHGAMKATMRQGQLAGTWTAQPGTSRYALGPLAFLRGEVTQWNDTIWTAHVGPTGELIVRHVGEADLPFSAHADIPAWREVAPIRAKNLTDLEAKLTPYLTDGPTFIKLEGRIKSAEIHAVNLPEGRSVSSPEEAHEGKTAYPLKSMDVQILAFASRGHRAVLTHHDTDFHLHLLSLDRRWMGHVDALGRGTYRVWIPQKTNLRL